MKGWKLATILVVGFLILSVGGYFGYHAYQDWDNKQLILGFSEDFPELIAQVEKEIGVPLTISSDCLTTQEKYSEGVALCGLTVGLTKDEYSNEASAKIEKFLDDSSQKFSKDEIGANKKGYGFKYRSKKSCQFVYIESLNLNCSFGAKDANKPLAAEVLNEQKLNDRKNEILKTLQ